MVVIKAIKTGFIKAMKMSLKICKVLIPAYFIIALLKYIGVLEVISSWFAPVMKIFGLPGDTALAIIFANGINIYASIGVLANLSLTVKQLTILGTMICLSHSLPVETSIIKTLKMPRYLQVILRLSLAIIVGIVMNLVWR